MNNGEAANRYGMPAIALHWGTALLIVCGFTLGLSMVGLPISRQKLQWYAWHKWIGITIWLLTCARLAWRLTQDLEINPPGVALALDLLDEIAALRAGVRRRGEG